MFSEIKSSIYYIYDRIFFNKKLIKYKIGNNKFSFYIKDRTSHSWYSNFKSLAYSELKLTKSINIKEIRNVLYCGSHQSVVPIIISSLLLKKTLFHCVEAINYNHDIAKKNVLLNNLEKKFKLYNYAVSDRDGILYFDSLKTNSNNTKNIFFKKKINAKNINFFIKKKNQFDLIYLDIEGMESKVLPALFKKNLLNIKYLFIELHGNDILKQYNSSNKKIYELLIKSKFKITIMNNKKIYKYRNGEIPLNRHYLMCSR